MGQPRAIGRYEVERLLGQGGMGRVWLARDTVLERRVAIKVLRDDLALPPAVRDELVERMRHEARAAAAVSHPNIVTLHDMGEDPDVGLFLVFEYVQGPKGEAPESLRDRLRYGPIALRDVGNLASELGSALSFAHTAGVIHRDIKPENILFSRTGAKIADFGIARIPDSTLTRANTVLGTPAYTAPEALSKGIFGPPSDQFALAATLYEAATGTRAFQGDDPVATAGKVSSEPPPPLAPTLGGASSVRALETTLRRGLAKSAEDRYASCADFGEAVARAIGDGSASLSSANLRAPLLPGEPIEVERTPLGSRAALARRSVPPPAMALTETPRPSVVLRKQTHRFQNVIAGAALIVLVVLVLIGRRTPDESSRADAGTGAPPVPSPVVPAASGAGHKSSRPGSGGASRIDAGTVATDSADASRAAADDLPRDR